jgi:hypothetical protein
VARPDIEKFQESSADDHSSTYPVSGVGVESRIMDDESSSTNVDPPSILNVVCGAPGIGARRKQVQERPADQHSFTYPVSGVGLEDAGVDLHIGTASRINCSALLSWMSRPGNWNTKKVQERPADQHPFTYVLSSVGVEG